ncbi:MAG TPA: type IV pilus secretin PilQ [Terriglobia bacterium]|nr:type IV pilus secretin PilQ [Terriglobia bacterium]
MKRSSLCVLSAIFAMLVPARGPVMQGNTRSSRSPLKDVTGAQASARLNEIAVTPSQAAPLLSRLTGISIQTADGGRGAAIEVKTSRPTEYRVMRVGQPDRLVLDLEGAKNGTDRWRYTSGSPLLERVRLGRFSPEYGGVIRIVADLRGSPACSVRRQPSGFRIELLPKGGTSNRDSTQAANAVMSPQKHLATVMKTAPSVAKTAAEPHALKEEVKPVQAKSRTTGFLAAPSKPLRQGTLVAAQQPPTPAAGNPRQPKEQELAGAAHAEQAAKVVAATQEPAVSRAEIPVTQNLEPQDGPKYTGKRISLNLKGVDIRDFFRLVHEVSGLNIIVDPDVSGSVTVVLDDVPWDQALDLVLNNNGLGDRLEGNVLRIARLSTLTSEQEERKKLAMAREDSAPLTTVFRPLSYAKAATIAALLKTWIGGGALSPRGTVLVDDRSNTLIISDIDSHVPRIETIVSKLDRKARQVSIQARIIRATSDFARNLSTALSFAQRNGSGSFGTGGATGNGVSGEPLTPATVTTSPATGFGVFVLSNLGANYAISAAIAAAETHDQAKTISQPSIVTQNNVEGTVIQGTQIPIQTTINNTISVQYVQASLQLKVTPQVTQDGNVFLTIDVENSTPGPALTLAGPTINTQSATTQVLVPDGGTVVFGGVTVHTKSNSATGIPLLDGIPVLGHLFKSTNSQSNDQELLFFVTPKILS